MTWWRRATPEPAATPVIAGVQAGPSVDDIPIYPADQSTNGPARVVGLLKPLGREPLLTGNEERTAGPSGEKQAIVLDIDNTSLETDFGFTFPQPPIEPVLKLSQYAHDRGVALFFVTARPGIISWPTEYNLEKVGYSVAGLYVRHLPDLFQNVADYKTAKRAEIEKDGYTIIANIGNSPTDISGGHAEKSFKLPDYDGRLS
ncbi:HAD family acid phosphatase [Streptomyces antimycoticus]|uniref:HAD family acid phosphatase n=1 Tax=Streptomyces antimycoticus TaxID=68175 RepID=UPI00386F7540|nr:hydrolase [Streptomyces antimycoticus]